MNLKELAKELNYLKEVGGLGSNWKTQKFGSEENAPKYISGDLNNASIEYKGKTYTVDFTKPEVGGEENPEDATSYQPEYDEPYNLIYRARVDNIEFEVEADTLGTKYADSGMIGVDFDSSSLEIRWDSLDANEISMAEDQTDEGTCGYAPGGEVDVHNTDKLTPAGPHLMRKRMGEIIEKIIKQTLKESKYFKTLDEEVNEDMQLAVKESQKGGGDFKSIAEKYNLDRFELEEAVEKALKELNEEPNEGNAFAVARLKAIKAGEDEFEVGGKKHKVTDVSDDDKKAAEEV